MSGPVHGRLDGELRLIEAEPRLAALQRSAGGEVGGPLAVPQVAALARLARRLGITISRPAVAAEGEGDLDLWVRAQPSGEGVALELSGWSERRPRAPASGSDAERAVRFPPCRRRLGVGERFPPLLHLAVAGGRRRHRPRRRTS